jgi:hypothetical protein
MTAELSFRRRAAAVLSGSTLRHRQAKGKASTSLLFVGLALILSACQVPATGHTPIANKAVPKVTKATPGDVAPGDIAGEPVKLPVHLTGDPQELMGLDTKTVASALGAPGQIRKEAPAQVWQYLSGECVLDLYLYDQGGISRVTYLEARSPKAELSPTERCVKSVLQHPTAFAN